MHRTLYDVLTATVDSHPDKLALIAGPHRLTYRDLAARVAGLAGRLQADGVRPGDRVVICAGNRIETVTAFWAALAAGGVAVVVGHEQRPERVRHVLADCAATVLLALEPMARSLTGLGLPASVRAVLPVGAEDTRFAGTPAPVDVISEDLAALVYTSGSTGDAKGVMLSHANMLTALDSLNEYLRNGPEDVFLCALPLAFDYGLYQMIMAFSQGATLVLERDMSLPLQVVKDIARYRCTVVPGVPVLFELVEQFSRFGMPDVSSVRCLTNTGAALLPRHIAAIRRLFPGADIYSMYGVTECKRCTYLPPELLDAKPGSVGQAIPNTQILVVDEQDRPCPPYQVGQLVVRGGTVMQGYWGLPDETARKIREHPVRGGRCLYTGDYGYLDEDGHFFFKGRIDEVIKVRGRKLIPRDVEEVLRSAPGVAEASVVCTALDDGDHDIAAFVAADPAAVDASALRAACRSGLETWQRPTRYEVLATLPRNSNGKVDKPELLRRYPVPTAALAPAGAPC
ncbi:class I adenylate-forming enzyme family protein [Micromonospora aurantiaca (nom. illeg.)]|uniref:class I adenylate-forming enzyme family protein n=1 Tax=Micromonospora aurantiaca (nom. illeg.) TaxID=47850 RepID=UPI003DA61D2B